MLRLTRVVASEGAGQAGSKDGVSLEFVMSLSGADDSREWFSSVGNGTTLDEVMQTNKMTSLWGISHEVIEQ